MRNVSNYVFISLLCLSELVHGPVANVEHLDLLGFLHDTENHSIDMRLVAIKQVPELIVFWGSRAPRGRVPKAANAVPEP